jgi:hypothetical protein
MTFAAGALQLRPSNSICAGALMTGDQTITGSAVITVSDQLRAFYWSGRGLFRTAGTLLIVALGIDLLLRATTSSEVDDGILVLAIPACILLWFGIPILGHRGLSAQQKRVTYEINADHVLTRDATGTAIVIPWSIMRRVAEGRSSFAIQLAPRGVRWLPKRAFTADSIASLRKRFRQMLGSPAVRLREIETL